MLPLSYAFEYNILFFLVLSREVLTSKFCKHFLCSLNGTYLFNSFSRFLGLDIVKLKNFGLVM